jgi:osmotically-inducible protein OsmY
MTLEQRSHHVGPPPDPRPSRVDIEAAVTAALGRNGRLRGERIAAIAGPEGLLTLTGTVANQALRREVELACWTVEGVWTLHDHLVVGR